MNGRNMMVLVTKRRMKSSAASGVHQSISLDGQLLEIDSLYLQCDEFEGWYEKGMIHDWLKKGNAAKVIIAPYPELQPMVSIFTGEKYVRSAPNGSTHDNLLSLPPG